MVFIYALVQNFSKVLFPIETSPSDKLSFQPMKLASSQLLASSLIVSATVHIIVAIVNIINKNMHVPVKLKMATLGEKITSRGNDALQRTNHCGYKLIGILKV